MVVDGRSCSCSPSLILIYAARSNINSIIMMMISWNKGKKGKISESTDGFLVNLTITTSDENVRNFILKLCKNAN